MWHMHAPAAALKAGSIVACNTSRFSTKAGDHMHRPQQLIRCNGPCNLALALPLPQLRNTFNCLPFH